MEEKVSFLKRKDIEISAKRYLQDALSAMALGLFGSLLIGVIFDTLGTQTANLFGDNAVSAFCVEIGGIAKTYMGAAIGVAVAWSLKAPPLVLFTSVVTGMMGATMTGFGIDVAGGPAGAFVAVALGAEFGKMVSKETKVDILVTPTVTILFGCAVAALVGPGVSAIMYGFGALVMRATEMQPFFMGILVSVIVGMVLTLPISSAALCTMLGLTGLAGGAATAGCCAQMIGFAVMSFRENGWGGVAAQGLGTSMLQMGNIAKNPLIWLPPTLASAITGPIATCLFKMENGIAVASGMGTCGLVGPIGVAAAPGFGSPMSWVSLILVCFVLPAVLTPLIAWPMRRAGWIKDGDCKLDL